MIVAGYEPKKVKPISLDELEKYLWGAAVLLRGQIDATSYKEYIFLWCSSNVYAMFLMRHMLTRWS